MALELRQSLKMSQQLVMTPQLQQAIKLLQLSRLELQQAVREELEVNPVLEEVAEDAPEEAPARAASAESAEEEAAPAAKDGLIDRVDWNYYFDDSAPQGGRSERERESTIPLSFWYLSLIGGLITLAYAIYRKDPVFITGQAVGALVYLRNLMLIYRKRAPMDELKA